ncbi:MAG: 30S ribosomal protein S8 [Parcubacteria group bacterium]|nr:30S ribosomal protein S8 [Parcubacteria group bacterium]
MMTDPISDMLTRIRNAQMVHKSDVSLPYSKMKFAIAKLLQKEGYVGKVDRIEVAKFSELHIQLNYNDRAPKIQSIRRVSKPGRRVYAKFSELPRVLSDYGIAIISTPNGIMTNKEARARHLGGEVICEIS